MLRLRGGAVLWWTFCISRVWRGNGWYIVVVGCEVVCFVGSGVPPKVCTKERVAYGLVVKVGDYLGTVG